MALLQTASAAAVAFAATNVDDVVLIAVLFARRGGRFGTAQIVAGQFAGFTVLVLASLAVGAGLLALPDAAVGALGLIPIALGVRGLVRARRRAREEGERAGAHARDAPASPGAVHERTLADAEAELPPRAEYGVASVASITIANGADNVAVYAPLFATVGTGGFVLTIGIFYVLLAALCVIAGLIGSRPTVVAVVDAVGDYAVPIVFVVLGCFIVASAV